MMSASGMIVKDEGYAWVVVAASFLASALQLGMMFSVGVYYEIFRAEFDGGSGEIALVGALVNFAFYMAGPVAGALTNRLGYQKVTILGGFLGSVGIMCGRWATQLWHLYLTYGVLAGFGLGVAYVPSVAIIGHYFVRRRSLAFGIATSGCGFGSFVLAPLTRLLADTYGWRNSLPLIGAVCLHICVCGALFREPPPTQVTTQEHTCNKEHIEDSEQGANKAKSSTFNFILFKNPDYLVLCANNFLFSFGWSIVYVHLGTFSETVGCTSQQGALLFSVIGAANTAGRFIYGLLAQMRTFGSLFWYIQGLVFCGVVTALYPVCGGFTPLAVVSACFGLFAGSVGPLLAGIQVELLGVHLFPSSYGYLLVFEAFGQLLGAPVAGWLYDWSDYYPASFYLSGITLVLSGLVMVSPWVRQRRMQHRIRVQRDVNT